MEYKADIVIAGGGLAGLVTAYELLDTGRKILILDRDEEKNLGGLAKESFGGIFLVDTPQQRRSGIHDHADLAMQDWLSFADFEEDDIWPKRWAAHYVENCTSQVYRWLAGEIGVRFFPVVHWVERGWDVPGNSVPRFHMVWGTGYGLIVKLLRKLRKHPGYKNLEIKYRHRVTSLITTGGKISGVSGQDESRNSGFTCNASQVVIASGGIAGNLESMKKNWYRPWGEPPPDLLNGSHHYSIGDLHQAVSNSGARITHPDLHWNYAAGVHHPYPRRENHGLSLVPPRSAIWLNPKGQRIGPPPLISSFDTRMLVEKICREEGKYSWQVMNKRIARKELAVSGSEYNDSIKNKNLAAFLLTLKFGNRKLLAAMSSMCIDYIEAGSVEELCQKMNKVTGNNSVVLSYLEKSISDYDNEVARGKGNFRDEQLLRIEQLKKYRGDRIRIAGNQKILDKKAFPLVAIREFILTRKTLGGIQTDLNCRVLDRQGEPIPGLYAVGESAGFGGGGIHGKRSLEGTFLGNCILNGRIAARAIKS